MDHNVMFIKWLFSTNLTEKLNKIACIYSTKQKCLQRAMLPSRLQGNETSAAVGMSGKCRLDGLC